jgi:hypothetical protein
MRRLAGLCVAGLLIGCASQEIPSPEHWTITYYDRNGDGVVDYELHTLGRGMADADWALVDTKFRGRYDVRIHWGIVFEKKKVDILVPKHVKITPGKPPKYHTV